MIFLLMSGFLCFCFQFTASQEKKQEEKTDLKTEITTEIPKTTSPVYNPEGRRDPFRELVSAGRGEGRRTTTAALGQPQISQPRVSIENMRLVGIIKVGKEYTAIMSGAQEFPLYIKVGHRFSDGYVLSISESKLVFRKLREGGVPLVKPRDIVKELSL